jgi:hypothetical protein
MHSSHHATAAHTLDPSVAETQTTNIVDGSSQPRDTTGLRDHDLPTKTTSENVVMSDTDDSTDYPADSASVLDEEHQEDSEEESAAEQDDDLPEEHIPLTFQIPEDVLRAAMDAPPDTRASFWSQNLYRGPNNEKLSIHYCQTPEVADRVARYFLSEKVVGFDIEWKPFASPSSIKGNASLVQLACENRIALFHISLFPGYSRQALMPANLKAVLESPNVLKVGVAIKGDFSRLTTYLGVQPQGVFELSRLRNLVEWYATDPSKVSNRLVGLAAQVLQHLQLPLYKGGQLLDDDAEDIDNVRMSDWAERLDTQQIHYAAADAYAGFRLYDVLEFKRKQLRPTPPRPGLCDYDPPKPKQTRKKAETTKRSKGKVDADTPSATLANAEQESDQLSENGYETAQEELMDSHQLEDPVPESPSASLTGNDHTREAPYKGAGQIGVPAFQGPDPGYPILPQIPNDEETTPPPPNHSEQSLSILLEASPDSDDSISQTFDESPGSEGDEFEDVELEKALEELEIDEDGTLKSKTNTIVSSHTHEYDSATTWAQNYLTSSIPQPGSSAPPRIRATVPHLRAYHLWHHQGLSLEHVARHLHDPPLPLGTVGSYVLQAITLERMQYDEKVVREIVLGLPEGLRRGRWRKLAEKVGVQV